MYVYRHKLNSTYGKRTITNRNVKGKRRKPNPSRLQTANVPKMVCFPSIKYVKQIAHFLKNHSCGGKMPTLVLFQNKYIAIFKYILCFIGKRDTLEGLFCVNMFQGNTICYFIAFAKEKQHLQQKWKQNQKAFAMLYENSSNNNLSISNNYQYFRIAKRLY